MIVEQSESHRLWSKGNVANSTEASHDLPVKLLVGMLQYFFCYRLYHSVLLWQVFSGGT
jgi:hypothetical protein